jgi:hypothetical protein
LFQGVVFLFLCVGLFLPRAVSSPEEPSWRLTMRHASLVEVMFALFCVTLPTPVDVAAAHRQESLQQLQRDAVLPATLAAHGSAASFSDSAAAFSGESKQNRSSAVSQCVRMVDAELRAIVAADDGADFVLPRLESWCKVYNVRVAKNQMDKEPARAVLFNETKLLWQRVRCVVCVRAACVSVCMRARSPLVGLAVCLRVRAAATLITRIPISRALFCGCCRDVLR